MVAWGDNSDGETNVPSLPSPVKLIAAGGDFTLAAAYTMVQYYPIDVSRDLLLVYNTNSADSTTVLNYYLANRPGVSNAYVLGIGFPGINVSGTNWYETTTPTGFTNYILTPVETWLSNNPTKRPQYVVLFLDVPSRVNACATNADNFPFYCDDQSPPSPPITNVYPSVSYQLSTAIPGWQPLITYINMNGTNDCIGYIDKLTSIDISGTLIISASRSGYGNTNYYFDDTENGYTSTPGASAVQGVIQNGAQSNAVFYTNVAPDVGLQDHLTNGLNVAGYLCWGAHSSLGQDRNTNNNPAYATDGDVQWSGNSGWYIIETIESFNGRRYEADQGIFLQWFATNAFGGVGYSNTPIGAVTHVDEPGAGVENSQVYFGLWAGGKNFAVCAWASRQTPLFQAVGDPFVVK